MTARIAVTGAAGFVGRALVRRLAERGWEVTALVRAPAEVEGAARVAVIGGLDDAARLRPALAGMDAVAHLAARVHVMRETAGDPLAAFRAVNVEGTRAVRDLAREAGVARLVFLSSVKAHGEGRAAPYRPDEPLAPADPYGVSKAEAEAVLAEADPARLGWTILRPPLVYGPGVGGNFRRLLRLAELAGRLPLPLGGIANRRSLVFVGNLADAIAHAAGDARAAGRRYLVADGEDLSTSDLLARLARAFGRPARLLPCPVGLAGAAARLAGRGAEAERLFGTLQVDASALAAELDWRAPFTVDEGLAATARWWHRERGR